MRKANNVIDLTRQGSYVRVYVAMAIAMRNVCIHMKRMLDKRIK